MNSLNKSEIITGVCYRGMLEKMQSEGLAFVIEGSTSLLIAPPYKIKAVQTLMTIHRHLIAFSSRCYW